MTTQIDHTFSTFDPADYLSEYYDYFGDENLFLMDFYHRFYQTIGPVEELLELGGGPTIYQLISASSCAKKIIFSEYLDVCRQEIIKCIKGDPESFNWDPYFEYVCKKESEAGKSFSVDTLKKRLFSRITETDIVECNLFSERILPEKYAKQYPVVSSNFCAESITDNENVFQSVIKKITQTIEPGGYLVMSLIRMANSYKAGDNFFPAYPVDEDYISDLLRENGCNIILIDSINAEHGRDYSGLICLAAVKSE